MKKKMYDAFMTIEASFVIPMSFLLMILLLYIGFFCYEKSISVQCCYLAALRGSNEWNLSGSGLENYVDDMMKQLVEEKYLVRTEQAYKIATGNSSVTVQTEGMIRSLFLFPLAVKPTDGIYAVKKQQSGINPLPISEGIRQQRSW